MALLAYLAFLKSLPADPSTRILGIPNRWFFVLFFATLCCAVETLLNAWGVLVWDWWWWGWPHIWSVFIFAYAPSVIFLFLVYDRLSLRGKAILAAGFLLVDLIAFILFAGVLGWV